MSDFYNLGIRKNNYKSFRVKLYIEQFFFIIQIYFELSANSFRILGNCFEKELLLTKITSL